MPAPIESPSKHGQASALAAIRYHRKNPIMAPAGRQALARRRKKGRRRGKD